MKYVLFHQPGHPEQPLHGAKYYWLVALMVLVAGLLYLAWVGLGLG